jgi:hypothetical protein
MEQATYRGIQCCDGLITVILSMHQEGFRAGIPVICIKTNGCSEIFERVRAHGN